MPLEKRYSELCRDLGTDYILNLPDETKKRLRARRTLAEEVAVLEELLREKKAKEMVL